MSVRIPQTAPPGGRPKQARGFNANTASVVGMGAFVAFSVLRMVNNGVSLGTIGAVSVVLVIVAAVIAPMVVGRTRSACAAVSKARPGAQVIAGFATPELAATLAGAGVNLAGAASGSALVMLALWPQGLEFVAAKGQERLVSVPWADVDSVSVGSSMLGVRRTPTVQVDLVNGAQLSILPASGTWWTTLIPARSEAIRQVERIETLRRAAGATSAH